MKHVDSPLCIDLDGTLVRTDTLVETAVLLIKKNPFYIFNIFLWLLKGKTALKHEIASRVELNASTLPYNEKVIDYAIAEKGKGRELWLVTAANELVARSVAQHLGIFDKVLASDETINLSASKKAKKLVEETGENNFDYVGNSKDDLKVWEHARNAIIVDLPQKHQGKVSCPIVAKIQSSQPSLKIWAKHLRVHQWAKNALIFVPFIAAHEFSNMNGLLLSILAFITFSLCASSVYILNDLLDLEADRKHSKKKFRPLASGNISLIKGTSYHATFSRYYTFVLNVAS